jgi:hypothetical protein
MAAGVAWPVVDQAGSLDGVILQAQCDNGAREPTESCDGADLAGRMCTTEGFAGGTLACKADCTFSTAACFKCGDGVVNGAEQCAGGANAEAQAAYAGANSNGTKSKFLPHLDLTKLQVLLPHGGYSGTAR